MGAILLKGVVNIIRSHIFGRRRQAMEIQKNRLRETNLRARPKGNVGVLLDALRSKRFSHRMGWSFDEPLARLLERLLFQ
jgi:hypothetical protein